MYSNIENLNKQLSCRFKQFKNRNFPHRRLWRDWRYWFVLLVLYREKFFCSAEEEKVSHQNTEEWHLYNSLLAERGVSRVCSTCRIDGSISYHFIAKSPTSLEHDRIPVVPERGYLRRAYGSLKLIPLKEAERLIEAYKQIYETNSEEQLPQYLIGYPSYGKTWEPEKPNYGEDWLAGAKEKCVRDLKKCIVFPVKTRRCTVVGFCDEMLRELEVRGWLVIDFDSDDLKEKLSKIGADIIVLYYINMTVTLKSGLSELLQGIYAERLLEPCVLYIVEDLNTKFQIKSTQALNTRVDAVLARYPEAALKFIPKLSDKHFVSFPHATSEVFFERDQDFACKIPRLLVSGNIRGNLYPLRTYALELFSQGCYPIDYRLTHNYAEQLSPKEQLGEYASTVATYQLALTGLGLGPQLAAPYVLAKHFEIPATGTVMVTDRIGAPLLKELGFEENVHYLTTTPFELAGDLSEWLKPSNAKWLAGIRQAGRQLVLERHSMSRRMDELEAIAYSTWEHKRQS